MKSVAEAEWTVRLGNRRVLIIGDERSSAGKRDYFSFDETGTPFHFQVSETSIPWKLSLIGSQGFSLRWRPFISWIAALYIRLRI